MNSAEAMPSANSAHLTADQLAQAAQAPWTLDLPPGSATLQHTGLRIIELAPGGTHSLQTGDCELIVIPLAGALSLRVTEPDVWECELTGRTSVFAGVSDVAYVPPASGLSLVSAAGGRFALAMAKVPAHADGAGSGPTYLPAEAIPVEYRGAGNCSRRVINFGIPGVLDAQAIIAVELITPAGNWSSYPPHKHDEERPGESVLEEIYYYEVESSPAGAPGMAFQRVYGTPERPIEVAAQVRSGDVVLIPHGWHGPSIAGPGYDLYYLNVMAGPGGRTWQICDDPDHAWVRQTWNGQELDPRVILTKGSPDEH